MSKMDNIVNKGLLLHGVGAGVLTTVSNKVLELTTSQSMKMDVSATTEDVFGGDGKIEPKRTGDQPAPEPSKYYEDVCYKQNGSMVQMCRNGSFRVTQLSSGSTVELMPDGTIIIHGEKDLFISAEGNMLLEVNGNFERRVKGTMQDTSEGPASYGSSKSSLNLAAATQGTMSGMGGLALKGNTTLDGRMDINGSGTTSGDWIVAGANSNHHSH